MALVVPNVVRMAFRGTWTNAQEVVNVLDLFITGQGIVSREEAVDATLEDAVQNWQTQLVGVRFPNNYTFLGADWVDLDSLDGRTGFQPADPSDPVTGPGTSPMFGPQAALVIAKVCPSRTRGRRDGRWYMPGATEAAVDENGVVLTTARTEWRNACLAFRTNVNQDPPLDQRFVRVGVVSDPTTAGLPVRFMEIDDFQVRPLVGTQRRRLRDT